MQMSSKCAIALPDLIKLKIQKNRSDLDVNKSTFFAITLERKLGSQNRFHICYLDANVVKMCYYTTRSDKIANPEK